MKKIILIVIVLIIILGIILVANQLGESEPQNTIEQASNTKITYSINNNMSYYNSKYSQRGVYYDTLNQPNAPHYYTIAMGQKNTGGYLINIQNVKIDNNGNVEVIVQENMPSFDDIVTMAFTYPICMIELTELPNSIVVKNTEGIQFENINF